MDLMNDWDLVHDHDITTAQATGWGHTGRKGSSTEESRYCTWPSRGNVHSSIEVGCGARLITQYSWNGFETRRGSSNLTQILFERIICFNRLLVRKLDFFSHITPARSVSDSLSQHLNLLVQSPPSETTPRTPSGRID